MKKTTWRIPFGKHGGKLLSEVPRSYLRWIAQSCDDIDPALRSAVVAYLAVGSSDAEGDPVDSVFVKLRKRYAGDDDALAVLKEAHAAVRRAAHGDEE